MFFFSVPSQQVPLHGRVVGSAAGRAQRRGGAGRVYAAARGMICGATRARAQRWPAAAAGETRAVHATQPGRGRPAPLFCAQRADKRAACPSVRGAAATCVSAALHAHGPARCVSLSARAQGGRGAAAPRSSRSRALAVAAGSILLSIAAVAMAVQWSGPTRLLQLGPVHVGNVEMHHLAAPLTNLAHKGMAFFESSPAAHARAMPGAPPAKPVRAVAEPAHAVKAADSGVVYYYMPPASNKGAKLAASHSKLQQMAAGNQILAAPPPGVFVAPTVGDGPAVRSCARPSHPCLASSVLLLLACQDTQTPRACRRQLPRRARRVALQAPVRRTLKSRWRSCAVRSVESADPLGQHARSVGQMHEQQEL